jgi:hypothetical protein
VAANPGTSAEWHILNVPPAQDLVRPLWWSLDHRCGASNHPPAVRTLESPGSPGLAQTSMISYKSGERSEANERPRESRRVPWLTDACVSISA